jgi:hypothetical protein
MSINPTAPKRIRNHVSTRKSYSYSIVKADRVSEQSESLGREMRLTVDSIEYANISISVYRRWHDVDEMRRRDEMAAIN